MGIWRAGGRCEPAHRKDFWNHTSTSVVFQRFTLPLPPPPPLQPVSLNNSVGDCSYLKEVLTYDVFREVGLPASRIAFAEVRLYMEKIICETFERFDVDGVELDFMRHPGWLCCTDHLDLCPCGLRPSSRHSFASARS